MDDCIDDHCEWFVETGGRFLPSKSPLDSLVREESTCFHATNRWLNSLPLQWLLEHITGEEEEAETKHFCPLVEVSFSSIISFFLFKSPVKDKLLVPDKITIEHSEFTFTYSCDSRRHEATEKREDIQVCKRDKLFLPLPLSPSLSLSFSRSLNVQVVLSKAFLLSLCVCVCVSRHRSEQNTTPLLLHLLIARRSLSPSRDSRRSVARIYRWALVSHLYKRV